MNLPQKSFPRSYTLLLSVFAVAVVISGAVITSTEVAARQSESTVSATLDVNLHRVLAIALTCFTLGFAIWTWYGKTNTWIRALAWAGFAVLVLEAVLGWSAPPLSPGVAVFHALLAHLFVSLVTVVAILSTAGWSRPPELVDGSSKPLLRPLAISTPPVVFLQIALGSMYRHDMTSVMPHMAIAMAVVFVALIGSSVILQNFPRPASLRRAAVALIAIVLTQVCLGIGAFLMLVLNSAGTSYFVATTVAHVAVGAAALAASVVMWMEVWRSVLPRRREIVTHRTE